MNILKEVNELLKPLNIKIETGKFSDDAPDEYIVLVPLADSYPISADNLPQFDVQELRISLFIKGNYVKIKNKIVNLMLANDFYVTERKYNGYDAGTGYYQYTIDVAKQYDIEEE